MADFGRAQNAAAVGCATVESDVEWRKQREEQEMVAAFQTMLRADQLRADKAFMERFRLWMRAKRAEFDQQLDRIGTL